MIKSTRLCLMCWCLLALVSLPQHLSAQTNIKTKKLDFQHPELDKSFADYQVFEISVQELYDLSQSNTHIDCRFEFGEEHTWLLELNYHDIRAANYREVAITSRGNEVLPRRPNITYRGSQGEDREPVRFTITPDYLVGMVQKNGNTYFLEPLQPMLPSAAGNLYVLYDAADVLVDPSLECSFTAGKKYALPPPEDEHNPNRAKRMECVEVDLATGGDILMFNRYGSVMAVNDFILNVTNLMEPLYDDFNLSYVIVDQFVVTSAVGNPWTTSNDAFTILNDFAAWAGPNFATHDIGQIWTANDIQGCGDGPGNFTLIGCARVIGGVCGSQRYNVCEDFSNSTNCLRALSAHEIGHLFDGVHGQANNSTIMWGNIVCGATTWTANNITRIQNHIDSRDCLSDCGACTIDLATFISRESCPGENDGTITAIALFNAGLVTYSITGPINDSNTTGLFNALPPGDYTVRAQDDGGGLNCFDEDMITIDDALDTAPPTNNCGDFSDNFNACPGPIDANPLTGVWFAVGGDLSFQSDVEGLYAQTVNLSGCVSDNFTSLSDIEIRLVASYSEGICPKTIVNEYTMRDECDNVSTDRIVVRHVFSESVAPNWNANCPLEYSENFDACPRLIDPNPLNGTWFEVGGDLSFLSTVDGVYPQVIDLSTCLNDNCTSLDDIEISLVDSYAEGICPKTIVNEFMMRDECGNIAPEVIVVRHIFSESIAPVWDFNCQFDLVFTTEDGNVCPADAMISLTEGEEITVNDGWTVGGINFPSLNGCVADECTLDNDLVIQVDDITITGDDCVRTITVTFLAVDECNNISLPFVCNYTFVDNTAPIVNYLGLADGTTLTVECNLADPNWDPFVPTSDLTIFDNCADFEDLTIVMEDELLEEGICGVSDFLSLWRCTWTVSDPCDNTTVYTLFTRIVDTQAPEWTFFPADEAIECDENLPFQQATAEDACSEVTIIYQDTRINGDCPYNYTIRRRWTAEDGCGNPRIDDQFIEVSDTTPPDILFIDGYVENYEDGQDVYTDCSEFGMIINLSYATRAYDNCSGERPTSFSYEDFGSFDCAEYGYSGYVRTSWSSTDECGNTATVTLNWYLVDQTPPRIHGVPDDICASILPPVPYVQTVDECLFASLEFHESEPIDCDGGQYVERSWRATDVCGNTTLETQRINLSDSNGPVINVNYPGLSGAASGSTVELSAQCLGDGDILVPDLAAAVEIDAGCSSTNDMQIDFLLLETGDCSSNGYLARYRLQVNATDICGNATNYELFIEWVDHTPPILRGPSEITLYCGMAIPEIVTSDDCGEVASVSFVDTQPIVASCMTNPQSFERIWTAIDACGNSSQFTQNIAILDSEGPVFSNVPDDSCGDSPVVNQVTAFDACSGVDVPVNFSESMSSEADCGQVLTRSWTATDACGNTSIAMQRIFFSDNLVPELTFDHPLLFGLEDGDELILPIASNLGDPSEPYDFGEDAIAIDDNCATNLTASLQMTPIGEGEDCAELGYLSQTRLTWTVTDPCGNSSNINLILIYQDTYGPDIFNVPADVVIYCEDPIPPVGEVFIKDDYDEDVTSSFHETYVSTVLGVRIIRTWTASDDCGNTTVAEQYIDIIDNTLECEFESAATIFCNSDNNLITVNTSGGTAPYTYNWEMTDCDGYITSDPTYASILFTVGYTTQNFAVTITDAVGCQRVCTVSVSCEKPPLEGLSFESPVTRMFVVYPNPVDQYLRIEVKDLMDKPVTLSMYNLYGQEIFFKDFSAWSNEIFEWDTHNLPNGTYFVKIKADDNSPVIREVVILH